MVVVVLIGLTRGWVGGVIARSYWTGVDKTRMSGTAMVHDPHA